VARELVPMLRGLEALAILVLPSVESLTPELLTQMRFLMVTMLAAMG
jgi:hypothetical protein